MGLRMYSHHTRGLPDESELHELLLFLASTNKVPGIAVGLSVNDHVILASAGKLSALRGTLLPAKARFHIACVTKLLVALLVTEMVALGQLCLEEPVEAFLPEFRGTERGRHQLLRHLLSFTTGYQDVPEAALATRRWNHMADALKMFVPGTVFSYEQAGFFILGEILQRITRQSMDELIHERISRPMGLSPGNFSRPSLDAGLNVVGHEYDHTEDSFHESLNVSVPSNGAISNLTLSAKDMLTIAQVALRSNVVPQKKVSAVPSLATPGTRPQYFPLPLPIAGTRNTGLPLAVGLGCFEFARGIYGVDGASYGQMCSLRFDPQTGMAISIGINVGSHRARRVVVSAIMSYIFSSKEPATRCRDLYDFSLSELPGRYVGSNGAELSIIVNEENVLLNIRNNESRSEATFPAIYDRGANSISAAGASQLAGISIFRDPTDGTPCIGLGMVTFGRA